MCGVKGSHGNRGWVLRRRILGIPGRQNLRNQDTRDLGDQENRVRVLSAPMSGVRESQRNRPGGPDEPAGQGPRALGTQLCVFTMDQGFIRRHKTRRC